MGLFKKKNQPVEEEVKNPAEDLKLIILDKLNEKLKGTLYDNCIIMPKGFTIDVQIGRHDEKDDIKIYQVIFIVKNDDFDEPLIDPVDSQGRTDEEAAQMAADIFYAGVWHPIDQSINKRNPVHFSVDYLRQHYDFDMYCQSVVRIGVKDKQPVMIMAYIKDEIAKYLGSKKYYWIRVYLAKMGEKKIIEVRVNGSVCPDLGKLFEEYVNTWDDSSVFVCEKQYAIFVQREDDKCPFNKQTVIEAAREAISRMVKIEKREDYEAMSQKLEEMTGDKDLAAEIRIFIPEVFAKLTLGYREGDSLFLMEGEGDDVSQIEFKKTQLRSYFYIQQAVLEFFNTRPPQEDVTRIVTNSVAFRELKKAIEQGKEKGMEIQPSDLFVPGTSYKINSQNYRVW
ncbi:MAG: hypothetical protein IKO47_09905 [Ruminococcus sp.]|nr:hypothetical protein [Ruminococcus sp.]